MNDVTTYNNFIEKLQGNNEINKLSLEIVNKTESFIKPQLKNAGNHFHLLIGTTENIFNKVRELGSALEINVPQNVHDSINTFHSKLIQLKQSNELTPVGTLYSDYAHALNEYITYMIEHIKDKKRLYDTFFNVLSHSQTLTDQQRQKLRSDNQSEISNLMSNIIERKQPAVAEAYGGSSMKIFKYG